MNSESSPHHSTFLIAAIIIAVLLVAAIFIAFYKGESEPIPPPLPLLEEEYRQTIPQPELLEQTESVVIPVTPSVVPDIVVNPVENLPETNPFGAETNPIDSAYKNPFE